MSFVRRYIDVAFSQGNISTHDLRVSAEIMYAGGMQMGTAVLLIYGMTESEMNELSTLGARVFSYPERKVTVTAGDELNGMNVVFTGQLTNAWADLQAMPQVVFHVEAQEDLANGVKPSDKDTSATSYEGGVPVEKVIEDLSKKMGYAFENNGVHVMLQDPYFFGSLRDQLMKAVQSAKIEHVVQSGKLAIWPVNGSRDGVIQVSKETGMRSAPSFTVEGVLVKKLFDKPIKHGSKMNITSETVSKANGEWNINRIDYMLESKMPHGEWFVSLWGQKVGMVM